MIFWFPSVVSIFLEASNPVVSVVLRRETREASRYGHWGDAVWNQGTGDWLVTVFWSSPNRIDVQSETLEHWMDPNLLVVKYMNLDWWFMTSWMNCIMLSKVVIGDDPQYFHVMIPNKSRWEPFAPPGRCETQPWKSLKFLRVKRISQKTAMVYSQNLPERQVSSTRIRCFFSPFCEAPDVVLYHIPRKPMSPPHLESLGNCGISLIPCETIELRWLSDIAEDITARPCLTEKV